MEHGSRVRCMLGERGTCTCINPCHPWRLLGRCLLLPSATLSAALLLTLLLRGAGGRQRRLGRFPRLGAGLLELPGRRLGRLDRACYLLRLCHVRGGCPLLLPLPNCTHARRSPAPPASMHGHAVSPLQPGATGTEDAPFASAFLAALAPLAGGGAVAAAADGTASATSAAAFAEARFSLGVWNHSRRGREKISRSCSTMLEARVASSSAVRSAFSAFSSCTRAAPHQRPTATREGVAPQGTHASLFMIQVPTGTQRSVGCGAKGRATRSLLSRDDNGMRRWYCRARAGGDACPTRAPPAPARTAAASPGHTGCAGASAPAALRGWWL